VKRGEEERDHGDLVGTVIDGRYRIIELVAVGAMAHIYLAERSEEPKQVALKVLSPDIAKNKTATARFHREAKAASRLHHPGIVRIFDWGVDGAVPYIAMELLDGRDLFELLEREGPLAQDRAVRLAIRICDALESAHRMGVVHRDLKPENVMVLPPQPRSGDEPVKVLDFGIAKLLARAPDGEFSEETQPQVLTKVGSAVGTPSHMAPEQARGANVDGRADVYAVGVLLYEMVTAHLPFEGDDPIAVAVRQVREPPAAPSTHFATIHPDLERVILSALEKDPEARWGSARALAAALAHVLGDLEGDHDEATQRLEEPDEEDLPTRKREAREVRDMLEKRGLLRTARGTVLIEEEDEPPTLSDHERPITAPTAIDKQLLRTLQSARDDDDDGPTLPSDPERERLERAILNARREAARLALLEAPDEPLPSDRTEVLDEPTDETGVATPQFDRMLEMPRTLRGDTRPLRARPGGSALPSGAPPPPLRSSSSSPPAAQELDRLLHEVPSSRPVLPVVLLLLAMLVAGSLVWFAFAGLPEFPPLRDFGEILRW
jgi:serine/threonine-protein kinase